MFEVYAFATPNSVKVLIALEELGRPYLLHGVNVRQGEQKRQAFVALNANAKVPVLVDPAAAGGRLVLTESAAILVYLAETTGRLMPPDGAGRARVFEQLFFHASGLGPAFGQAGFFRNQTAEPQPLAADRFSAEANRTLGLLDRVLCERRYVAGDDLTVADIAHFGWLWRRDFAGISLEATPHVARWYDAVATRPAVERAVARVNALVPRS